MHKTGLTIVFQHGFGFSNSFWNSLLPYFAEHNCILLEENYFRDNSCVTQNNCVLPKNIDIAVGHSLGFVKLLHNFSNIKYLIGLNAFTDFLCSNSVLYNNRLRDYNIFLHQFILNTQDALQGFYRRCGITNYRNDFSFINKSLMMHDLDLLIKKYNIPTNQDIVIINAQNDIIVPMNVTQYNFQECNVKIQYLPKGNHILGILYPEIISQIILELIS